MNPAQVAQNRTARLVREAQTPVYSTATPVREHIMAVEWEWDMGGRYWTEVRENEVDAVIEARTATGTVFVSDVDHSAKCWCQK